jgi:3,4-dihydroxy 2-butanone 4-phosphate synthase/GTP cyclohydrolase II
VAKRSVESAFGGAFTMHVYETKVDAVEHLALVKGDVTTPGPVLVRVHAVNPAADLLGIGDDPGRAQMIERSMKAIEAEGRGVLVLLRDLRPKAVSQWLAAEAAEHARGAKGGERRQVEIGIGSQILHDLGVRDMILLSNSPASVYVGLEGYGLRVLGTRRVD